MPRAWSRVLNTATAGAALGSSWVTYAAVAGRWLGGSEAIQATNRSGSEVVVPGWAKNRLVKPRVNRDAAPPDGSTYSIPCRAAMAEAGALSSEENVPSSRLTLSWLISRGEAVAGWL